MIAVLKFHRRPLEFVERMRMGVGLNALAAGFFAGVAAAIAVWVMAKG